MRAATPHIELLFAESAYGQMLQERYGLKNCHQTVALPLAADLRDVLQRAVELEACAPGRSLGVGVTLTRVEERINTL